MKKLIAFTCMFLASITQVHADSFEDCDEKLQQELLKLIESDSKGILALQFKLTSLKISLRGMQEGSTTLEDMVKSEVNELNARDQGRKVRQTLGRLYQSNEGLVGAVKVAEYIKNMKSKTEVATYWARDNKLANEDVSAFLLLDKSLNPRSPFDASDIAMAWFMRKTAPRNRPLAESEKFSNVFAQHMGHVRGIRKMTRDQLEMEKKRMELHLKLAFSEIARSLQWRLNACLQNNLWKGICPMDGAVISKGFSDLMVSFRGVSRVLNLRNSVGNERYLSDVGLRPKTRKNFLLDTYEMYFKKPEHSYTGSYR